LIGLKRRRGEIEEHLKRVFFHGPREDYVVFVKYRVGSVEELRPIPANMIDDVRGGYIFVGGDKIPFHRVVEIRTRDGKIVYSRLKEKPV